MIINIDTLLAVFIFIIGLCIGSFSNVVIYRLKNLEKKKREIFFSRSFCPKCKHKLGFFDLVPFFSWVFLLGKCRYCKARISPQYPLAEISMGILFLFSFFWSSVSVYDLSQGDFQNIPKLLSALFTSFVMVVITAYDILYMEIPDEIMLPSIMILALLATIRSILALLEIETQFIDPLYMPRFLDAFVGLAIPVLFFIFQILISGGAWIGGGDLRIAAFMGLLLGWKKTLAALALGYCLGSVVGLILIFIYKKIHKKKAKESLKMRIPFGPFLAFGTLASYFYGDWLVHLYVKFLFDY